MAHPRRHIELVQLPIPQPGMEPARGNVPLAAGYLKLYARRRGLDAHFGIGIFPNALANRFSDRALVEALLAREPWMVGFTCYLWNVERTLWIAQLLKERRPDLFVLLGGPEITPDNDWVLRCPQVDFAAIGEGEQTFAELLQVLREDRLPQQAIPGLYVSMQAVETARRAGMRARTSGTGAGPPVPEVGGDRPPFRRPLAQLDEISSPYLEGILDAGEERMLMLETLRGCVFQCKFCYYPKSYDDVYFLSEEKVVANLRHARERGVREVILLDPTLNQRRDFAAFLRLLARCNPEHEFTYFGELRAEGIDAGIASLLRRANFTEVEIGLQSTDAGAQRLMDRRNNMKAFERGVRALRDAGVDVKIDLIVGLPGDDVASVRRSMAWVRDGGLYADVQVFTLAVLPGTAFRQEARQLGLEYQPRPPYYVLRTPTLRLEQMYELMAEAEDLFGTEFDALPAPQFTTAAVSSLGAAPLLGAVPTLADTPALVRASTLDLDAGSDALLQLPPPAQRAQAFTLWLFGKDLAARRTDCVRLVRELLDANPHTTLQIVLEPRDGAERLDATFLESLREACYRQTTYLDRFYAVLPGPMKGSKRLVIVLPLAERDRLGTSWIDGVSEHAAVVWRGPGTAPGELQDHEHVVAG